MSDHFYAGDTVHLPPAFSRWRRFVWRVKRTLARYHLGPKRWAFLGCEIECHGMVRTIVEFNPSTNVLAVDRPWTEAPATGDPFQITPDTTIIDPVK